MQDQEPDQEPEQEKEPDTADTDGNETCELFDHTVLNVSSSVEKEVEAVLKYVEDDCGPLLTAITEDTAVVYPPLMMYESQMAYHEEKC